MPERPLPIFVLALLLVLLLGSCAPRAAEVAELSDPLAVELLRLVNDARHAGGSCGVEVMPPVGPLTLNSMLSRAAQLHALDMKRRGKMSHVGSDGSSVGRRVDREGYEWKQVAENVAYGYPTAAVVMAAWLKSESHCRSIFAAPYLHLGVGEVDGYWTQVFAAPR